MKIIITEEQAREIVNLRKPLIQARAQLVGSIKGLAKFERRKEELEKEIAELESGDPSDKRTRAALRDSRDELELTEKRIEELNHQHGATGATDHSRTSSAVNEMYFAVERALRPSSEAYLAEITSAFRPFFAEDSWARKAAFECPAFFAFSRYISRRAPMATFPAHVDACIALADEVLAGEIKFEFNPNTK